MATRVIKTRIQNKIDTLTKWSAENPKLLLGEIAIAKVENQQFDEAAGSIVKVPAYLIKVGDGEAHFNSLPWIKASAADVYDWAKTEKIEDVNIAITNGTTTESKTFKEWLEFINNTQATQDSAIAINTAKLTGHTDEAINALILAKLAALDSTVADTTAAGNIVVKNVIQADGKVTVTKGPMSESDLPELHTNKIVVADATLTTNVVTLDAKLTSLDNDIKNINAAIAGGVHFVGITTTDLSQTANLSSRSVTIKNSSGSSKVYTANTGDIVIQDNTTKEFIWNETVWQELGDQSRIGALETTINNLNTPDTAVNSQFVTAVTQANGKIAVSRRQPKSADIIHGEGSNSSTVGSEISSHAGRIKAVEDKLDGITKVTTSVSDAINALDVPESAITAGTATTSFISSLKQENGKIIATKATVSSANSSTAGIVKLNDNINSTSTTEAATANAVKKAYDVGYDAQGRVSVVEGNYIKVDANTSKMYFGKSGTEEIIFDCGGVPNA